MKYDKFIVLEAIPENWECMFDSDTYFKEFNSFDPTIKVEEPKEIEAGVPETPVNIVESELDLEKPEEAKIKN